MNKTHQTKLALAIVFMLLNTGFLVMAEPKINQVKKAFFLEVPSYLKIGDILFCRMKEDISEYLDKFNICPRYTCHCAMYIGNNRFIEAAPYRYRPLKLNWLGVVISPFWKLQLWAEDFSYGSVNTTNEIREKAVQWAKTQLGNPYQKFIMRPNSNPQDTSDAFSRYWYCSELIWAAYWNQGLKLKVENDYTSWNANTVSSLKKADNILLYENEIPMVDCGGPYEGSVDERVYFDSASFYDSDGIIMKYNWSFGDGNFSNGQSVSHRYTKPGVYMVTLTVKDSGGAYTTNFTKAIITKKNQGLYNLSITGRKIGYRQENLNYSIRAYDLDNDSIEYTIYWGDGENDSSGFLLHETFFNISHLWEDEGCYDIIVEATDGEFIVSRNMKIEILKKNINDIEDEFTNSNNEKRDSMILLLFLFFIIISLCILSYLIYKKSFG